MKRRILHSLGSLVWTSLIVLTAGCATRTREQPPAREYHRIISLAPSVTETIFALGAQDRIVGVTKFCVYPPEAKELPNVGGYIDPNYEAILRLKPDLVILLKEHANVIGFLKEHGIASAAINNQRVPDILASFTQIGRLCGRDKEAGELVSRITSEFSYDSSNTGPRILLCVGRDGVGSGAISKTWLAGPKSFYSELLVAAGARNAVSDSGIAFPMYSAEAILRLEPDIVVDLMPSMAGIDSAAVHKDWVTGLSMSKAVKSMLVFCLNGSYLTIPGPRMAQTLRDFKRIVATYREMQGGSL